MLWGEETEPGERAQVGREMKDKRLREGIRHDR
jgi:hypothetical protein